MAASAPHLVHGMGTTLEPPTWPAITHGEAAAALARFPAAGQLEALEWHSPRPFSAAARVRTTRGVFVLKRHHPAVRAPAVLAEEHAFIAHLAAGGIPVPEILLTDDGTSAITVGEWTYELHRQGAGLDLYRERLSWTPFFSVSHAHAAGASLARLHAASRGFLAPARAVQPLVASFTILPSTDPLAATEAYVAARPALAAFLERRDWRSAVARLFAELGQGVSDALAGCEEVWTHNDWHPSNLLWSADGQVETVFDFGLADRTCAVHDLATAIERTAIDWLELGQGRDATIGHPETARALLAGYATVLPLDRGKVEAVLRVLPLVHLEFALSEIDYFAGVVGDVAEASVAWEQYLLGHADWFLAPHGQAFLHATERGALG
ncbi:phosphotransferase enzyme family protein [Sphingomonas glacialis]|uniref:Aminoglycoside phosphotransferase family protein n=1 Tax=Sphingomonas glacialis TaxID=658225 RepID=A0A502G0P4_9SPHN|nr:phosphotransferase [Sphingomonas glacialis]TPG54703.1 aminoglycoside phosphotransferase family protein [Sphingomonas glacialis]